MSARKIAYVFLAAITVLRLVLISQVELSPDEAYYYQWSERMDWSYFSKGPGVAATIWLSTHIFGANEFGVRFFSPLLALGTCLLMFSFARRLYSESVGLWAIVMMNCTPIFQVGGLVMTIDPLSIFFWMAALYAFWLALERTEFSAWWPATGALIGLGFLAKFTNAMQLLSILLLLVITPKWRREFRRAGFYTMLGTFAVFTAPPIIWNAQHDWITLEHLGARGGLHSGFRIDLQEWISFVGAHFGVYSPLIFAAFCVAAWWGVKLARVHFKPRFLLAFALPLFALYLTLSLKQAGEANWTAPATLSLSLLTAALWYDAAREKLWARRFAVAALSLGVVVSVVAIDMDLLRSIGIPIPYDRDAGSRLRGWRSAAELVGKFRTKYETETGAPVFLIANKYGTAASLAFYLPDEARRVEGPGHPPVYVPESQFPENQYFFWPRYDENIDRPPDQKPKDEYFTEEGGYNPFLGHDALYITDRAERRPPTEIKRGFESVELIASFDQVRNGLPLRQIRIFVCRRYKQIDL